MLLALRVKSVSGEGGGMIRGVLSSHGRDNQPSVYGWNRRWPLRVRSVSGEGGGMPSTASPSSLPVLISQCVIATPQP
jgi:hypothetical protein